MRKKLASVLYLFLLLHGFSHSNWLKRNLSLTIYLTDSRIHAKSIRLAIRTNPVSRLSSLGASIKKKLLRKQINSRWIYSKIYFIIKSWWLSWLRQYGLSQVLCLRALQIKNSSEENLQDRLRESQNFILLLSLEMSKVIVHRLEKICEFNHWLKSSGYLAKAPYEICIT